MEAKEIYPDLVNEWNEDGSFYGPYDYEPILELFGEIIHKVDDDDYQGDSRVLYKKDGQYGYLIFGWGSCSGCDSLQGCSSYAEIDELIEDLRNSVKWFDSLEELKTYFKNKDWELEYSWRSEETKKFVDYVLSL